MNNAKKILGGLAIIAIIFCVVTRLSAALTQQKANQMIQNLKGQTAQLASVQAQPILSEMPVADVTTLKNNVAKDMQNIRNDMKKIVTLLQTLSANQQEILSNMQ